ncbi:MAG: glycosyltransferase family 39 protein [Isosphaeraceae bacterium]|nr:glycosyltransferase family 39 protein [Isosphaeraceae bacterium]
MTIAHWSRRAAPIAAACLAALSIAAVTDFHAPPRYDGAGYSVLAAAIGSGRGYRSIDHPDAPSHVHFPPGYPAALAAVWSITGRSVVAARIFSLTCTSLAVGLIAVSMRRGLPGRAAWFASLAVAVDWAWARNGGAIQSEPLFLLLVALAIAWVGSTRRRMSIPAGLGLGLLLAAATLTRHVGVCLAAACWLELLRTRDFRALGLSLVAFAVGIAPWVVHVAAAPGRSQAGLLDSSDLGTRIADQALFYARRIPDVVIGPVVETATVFGRSRDLALAATLAAIGFTALVLAGGAAVARRGRGARIWAGFAGVSAPVLLVWPFTEAGRFLIPLLPAIVLGLVFGLRRVPKIGRRLGSAGAAAVVLALALPYPIYAVATGRARVQRDDLADLDRACDVLLEPGRRAGPVLSRHPGEVWWRTGRTGLALESVDPADADSIIEKYSVAYAIDDADRFANAEPSGVARYARDRPARVRLIRDGRTRVYEILSAAK